MRAVIANCTNRELKIGSPQSGLSQFLFMFAEHERIDRIALHISHQSLGTNIHNQCRKSFKNGQYRSEGFAFKKPDTDRSKNKSLRKEDLPYLQRDQKLSFREANFPNDRICKRMFVGELKVFNDFQKLIRYAQSHQ